MEVERPVATYREKPLGEMVVHGRRRLRHEPDEGVLHHVAGTVGIAHQPRGIAQQRCLVQLNGGAHKRGGFIGGGGR